MAPSLLLADIHPIRLRLLELYDSMINSPQFLSSRPWTVENVLPFDRKDYMDALTSYGPPVPDEFRMWIMEWPARMAITGMWPGLPFGRRKALNYLASPNNIEPSALIFKHGMPAVHFIPALLIWRQANETIWLVLDCPSKPILTGRVFRLFDHGELEDDLKDPAIIPYNYHKYDGSDLYDGDIDTILDEDWVEFFLHSDWITFLHKMWKLCIERGVSVPWHAYYPTGLVGMPNFVPDNRSYQDNPAPLWSARHEPV